MESVGKQGFLGNKGIEEWNLAGLMDCGKRRQ